MRAILAMVGVLAVAIGAQAAGVPTTRPIALKLATSLDLENKRPVALLNFEIILPARDKTPERVIGKLDKPLAAGDAIRLPLTGGAGCAYQARWAFEDFQDAGDVDLCNDARIVLVD
jgi:hypothetical protein